MRMISLISLLSAWGCNGSEKPEDTSGGDQTAELTCDALALCTTHEVKTFLEEVPEAAGGKIQDGFYRLAWKVESHDNEDFAGYGQNVEGLRIGGDQFVWAGFAHDERGKLKFDGVNITFEHTHYCNLGEEGDTSTYSDDYQYTATADRLDLFGTGSIGGEDYTYQLVFLRTDDPNEICDKVESEPASQGPSADCFVTNCGCVVTVGEVIDRDICPA